MATIQLQSSDGKQFTVAMEIAKKSVTIKTMLEDLGFESGDADQEPGMFVFFIVAYNSYINIFLNILLIFF